MQLRLLPPIARRIYRLLSPDERKKSVWAVLAVFGNVLLDFAGLASLLPIFYFLLGTGESRRAAMLFCGIAIAVILLKCVTSTLLARFQSKFLLALYKRLSLSLFLAHYNKGLLFIRGKGTNKLSYEINSICYHFSQGLLAPFIRVMGDGLLLLLALVALFFFFPLIATVILVSFTPFIILYMLIIRKRVKRYGDKEQVAKREQWGTTVGAFSGYSDLEVNNALPRFRSSFESNLDEIITNRLHMNMLTRLPLFFSELSALIGLCLMVWCETEEISMLVGVFAVAAFRLLPAMRSLLQGYTQIKNATFCIDIIEEGLAGSAEDAASAASSVRLPFRKGITFARLSYAYPDGASLFSRFNCSIAKGEYVGFCGTSGIGKTTLFNLLLGFLSPDDGEVLIDDTPLTPDNRRAWLALVGYVSQEIFIFNGTLAENIALADEHPDRTRIEELLKCVFLDDWAHSLPQGIDTPLGERGERLSGGQKQRIGIARALYRHTDLLLLDEATSSLDNTTEREINQTIRSLREQYSHLTILSIAHRQSTLEYCDRIIDIENYPHETV